MMMNIKKRMANIRFLLVIYFTIIALIGVIGFSCKKVGLVLFITKKVFFGFIVSHL